MRLIIAILLGKLISYSIRILKIGGGSAAPGLYALSVAPDLVKKLASQIPVNVVITGTNGKTTTAKMLTHFAKTKGLKVIRNHTGSNLERGIASTLIQHSSLLKDYRINYDLGIWELDEATFNTVALKLRPNIVVFLNVFRDQLDRYGEIDTITKNWCQTLAKLPPKTSIIVNGDDINTLKLIRCSRGKIQKFGVKDYKIIGESIENIKENENLDFEAKNVKVKALSGSSFQLTVNSELLTINLPLPGIYHIYNFLAAFAVGSNLGLQPKQMIQSLKDYSPAFGRVEKLPFGYIFLIKNPAGATQVFETIVPNLMPADTLLLALNDNIADGKDVSWIWDAEFEKLTRPLSLRGAKRHGNLIISGKRAYDLALRLKYAGINSKEITVEPNLRGAFRRAIKGLKRRLFILPTYTAMLELQSILTKVGLKKHYWKEEV